MVRQSNSVSVLNLEKVLAKEEGEGWEVLGIASVENIFVKEFLWGKINPF